MTTIQLSPQLRTVEQLFDDHDATYTVPVYQRNFAWRAEQIEQLISDVHDAMADGEDGYFLGNLIVTERLGSATDFEIIDGQQRLTTLYLLLTILAGDGDQPYDVHTDRLRYESRPRATDALRRVVAATSRHTGSTLQPSTSEDTGIYEGVNVIHQFLNQHPQLRTSRARGEFADYLRSNVTLVRANLPPGTDLNRYFEIMNTRGQQLLQVDIVKARLMSHLADESERACFAWIWDACADMDSYVQMSLTRGDTQRRDELFGKNWSWLAVKDFHQLAAAQQSSGGPDSGPSTPMSMSLTLDQALAKYAVTGVPLPEEDVDNVRFRSTIEFPAFLLHVLKVVNRDEGEHEGQLDDKRLVKRFDAAVKAAGDSDQTQWVRDFAVTLLKLRNLFDAFILKRQYTATNVEDGDWSLHRLLKRMSKGRPTPGYINTYPKRGTDADADEEGDTDPISRELLLLQSMLRVTYTSPRTMHWITEVLTHLADLGPADVEGSQLTELLRSHARGKVEGAFFSGEEPQGFNISRIVFTYLDYLLLKDQQKSEFRFAFRNSIEHFFPQSPDEQQSGAVVSPECLNLLGNLALVSVSANSKFSNSLPRAKAENYRTTIEMQSPKLKQMAAMTRAEGWGDEQVRRHHKEVTSLLVQDLAESGAVAH